MAESAALLVDEMFPEQPVRQWVLSFPYSLRFLFASRPAIMGQVLGIDYRVIAGHLIKKAGFTCKKARTGAVALIQRFGSALHLHTLFPDGVYVIGVRGAVERLRWGRAPTTAELTESTHTLARRVGGVLQRQALLECDRGQSFLDTVVGLVGFGGIILKIGRKRPAGRALLRVVACECAISAP